MSDKYLDPANTLEIIDQCKAAPTLGAVLELVNRTFPGWVVTFLEGYSADYPGLTWNWEQVCATSKSQPAQVMIVDSIQFEKTHTLLRTFAEVFTTSGFSVRRKTEMGFCDKCRRAIPVRAVYDRMHRDTLERGRIPVKWSTRCTGCE